MDTICEVVDYTDDERYYPLAVFKTLEQTKHEIESGKFNHTDTNMSDSNQTVKIEAGYSFDRATEVIMELILNGFSVEANTQNNARQWIITAEKQPSTE